MRQALLDLHQVSRAPSTVVPQTKNADQKSRGRVVRNVLLMLLVLFIGGVATVAVSPRGTLHTEMRSTEAALRPNASSIAPMATLASTESTALATTGASASAQRAKPTSYGVSKPSASKALAEPSQNNAPPLPTSARDPMEIRR
jgi:hypothetical protein